MASEMKRTTINDVATASVYALLGASEEAVA